MLHQLVKLASLTHFCSDILVVRNEVSFEEKLKFISELRIELAIHFYLFNIQNTIVRWHHSEHARVQYLKNNGLLPSEYVELYY